MGRIHRYTPKELNLMAARCYKNKPHNDYVVALMLYQAEDMQSVIEKIVKCATENKWRDDEDQGVKVNTCAKLHNSILDDIIKIANGKSVSEECKVGKAVQIDVPQKSMEKAREMLKDEARAMANAAEGKPSVEGQWLAVRGCMDDRGDECVILRVGHGIGITKEEYARANAVIGIPQSDEHFLECVNKLNDEDRFPRLAKTFRYSEIKEYLKEDGPFYKNLK